MTKDKSSTAIKAFGSPERLIKQFIKGDDDRIWALAQVDEHGPPHKQLQHIMVLNRLERLFRLLNKRTGPVQKKRIEGVSVTIAKGKEKWQMPVQLPIRSLGKIARDKKVFEALIEGPEHEILYTALLLQVIEDMIGAEEVKQL
jgi:hypothetical protein